ncbi:MAG: FeoB-associated Cys-rich membrane protein [Bacillota bacterium]|nr:FeoB-associated Cys-rich membrane protein [Bacillota bacterium]
MVDIIIGVIILAAVAAAAVYIIKEKKKGSRCIGCSAGCSCGNNKNKESGHMCDRRIG